jgi:hypothetical protein
MIPYSGPEFIEALLSLMADEPEIDTSAEASRDAAACKKQDGIARSGHVPLAIAAVVWAIGLIAYVVAVCT